MARVLVNVTRSDWAIHFIGPDGRTRVGPWLLLESADQVRTILKWGGASAADLEEHATNMRRWGASSVALEMTDGKLEALIARAAGGRGQATSCGR